MPDPSNILIVHIHDDDELIAEMTVLLVGLGFQVLDSAVARDEADDGIGGELLERLEWADVVVVLIAPGTADSPWVERVIERAQQFGTRVVAVWARGAADADVPDALTRYGDAVLAWKHDVIDGAIRGGITTWQASDGEIRPPRQIERKCQ